MTDKRDTLDFKVHLTPLKGFIWLESQLQWDQFKTQIIISTCVSPSKSTTSESVNLISISFVHWFPLANNIYW